MNLVKVVLAFTLLFHTSALARAPSSSEIQGFYTDAMVKLSEISETLFASEGEGTPLAEKVLQPEDEQTVLELMAKAVRYQQESTTDASLQEVIRLAKLILQENKKLTEALKAHTEEVSASAVVSTDEQVRAYLLQAFRFYQITSYCSENFVPLPPQAIVAVKADINEEIRKNAIANDKNKEAWDIAYANFRQVVHQVNYTTCENIKFRLTERYPVIFGGTNSSNPFN